jgi:hypothetical protein
MKNDPLMKLLPCTAADVSAQMGISIHLANSALCSRLKSGKVMRAEKKVFTLRDPGQKGPRWQVLWIPRQRPVIKGLRDEQRD